jgi:hypothetical protein
MLVGSQFDFPSGPPPGTIAIGIPGTPLVGSKLIYPDATGFATHESTTSYDRVIEEGGKYSYAPGTFAPSNLCRSPQDAPARGQLRPYVSPWRPPSEARTWDSILRQGLFFDLTVEEGRPDLPRNADDQRNDYVYSGVSMIESASAFQGGLPFGAHVSLPSVIQNVGPNYDQSVRCQGFVSSPQVITAPLYCRMPH